ncbi:Auxin Efflux Carrier [Thermobaculum terrenum ATCC BAA-798]|uniref:Auxin Efflux Carrier n=1 Tax=Thermobaculum terrenum (strain ATCC BAA-798 / CCMEE 7001 / YNP1) TaxID=525904 RepID=D1CFZ8_THET1|nr:Auxin Efflux Carrier [Thermobaculum terrenum ATCC BAA-798]
MLSIFINTTVPVFIIVLAGMVAARCGVMHAQSLARLSLYVLSPALVFSSLVNTSVTLSNILRIGLSLLILAIFTYLLGTLVCELLGVEPYTKSSYLLSTILMNSGNFGLPVILFAFGDEGLAVASIYFVIQSLLTNTLGVYIASRGMADPKSALMNTFKLPTLYAIVVALPFLIFHFPLPQVVNRPIDLLGSAAIPILLLMLGAQLRLRLKAIISPLFVAALITRLVISPLIAYMIGRVMGLEGLILQVFVVESAMPTAVNTIMLATVFKSDTDFLSNVIAFSTLVSMISLTLLISLLGATG